MVNRDSLLARLERLRGYLAILKQIRAYDRQAFIDDYLVHGAAERYLQLSAEALFDIGNHVIADRSYRKPESYAEIFSILSQEGDIPRDLFEQVEGLAGFRNLLVHDYLRIDPGRVYDILQERTAAMERLAEVYARLL